jgi:formylglycine-generating enzyme required for sulfatase activity
MRPHDQKLLHRALPASSPTRLLALLMPLALAACAEAEPDKGGADGGGPNSPPGAPTVLLSPAAPTTTQDVAVVIVSEAVDPDGDAVSYRYLWLEDGAVRDDLTAATLPAAETRKGQVWTVSVIASDGELDGGVGEASATVVNTPPVASVSLPSAPDTEDALVADAAGVDDDGDAVTLRYAWAVDGAASTWADATVPASATARGQVWAVTVTPNDGEEDGAAVSAEVTIANTLPVADAVSLTPSLAYENSVVQSVIAGAADADGDPITPTYTWLVNGVAVSGEAADTLSGAVFDKGDTVQVRVELSDGVGVGAALSSAALTIQNTPPTAPVVAISPADPLEGEALVCEVLTASADADGDLINYTFTWEVDGVAYADAGSTVRAGDTVLAGETFAGEEWTCAAVGSDGSASSAAGEASRTVESDCGDGSITLTASGIDFVTVCASAFDMGCTPGQSSCEADESPVRPTTLTRDYLMSRTEVTQGQFAAVMGYSPSGFTSCGATCPVENVSWHEAAHFANAVSTAAGLSACYSCSGSGESVTCSAPASVYSCAGYRLPTEAEWEGAARCGEDLLYAGSNTIGAVAWYNGNSGSRTRTVGGLASNVCGLYDMSGNIWEWTNDWYSSAAYGGGAATDPAGPASGSDSVIRGGAWAVVSQGARVANRGGVIPGLRGRDIGVRLVRTAP